MPNKAALPFVITLFFVFLMIRQMQPPAAAPVTAPAAEFSSARALEHVRQVAPVPHPTGSQANRSALQYIRSQMTGLGLECQVQTALSINSGSRRRGLAVAADVENLVCRSRGTASTRAVMLSTHYDSVPTGPGASDDSSGVATLIETARALHAGPPLRNDVVFLFTDAEELGLLGARAFAGGHPWAADVGLAINFEARGASGPSLLFETSDGNATLVSGFAHSAPDPQGSSFMYDFYRRMPNDTDMTVFKKAGIAGLNFAYGGDWPRYHTMGDSIANLDERSLQHDGSNALALARYFGSLELPPHRAGDAVFFSLLGMMPHYRTSLVLPLTAVAVLGYAGVLSLGFRRRLMRLRSFLLGATGVPVGAVLASAAVMAVWRYVGRSSLVAMLPYGMAYNGNYYAAAAALFACAVMFAVGAWAQRNLEPVSQTFGILFWWLLLSILTAEFLPGGSYAFVLPLLAAIVVLVCALGFRLEGSLNLAFLWTFPAAVAVLVFGPMPYLLSVMMSTTALQLIATAVALLAAFLVPQINAVAGRRRWLLPVSVALLAGIIGAVGAYHSGYDAGHPRATTLFYSMDADKGEAWWATADTKPNDWTAHFLTGTPEQARLTRFAPIDAPILISRAPEFELAPAAVSFTGDAIAGSSRKITVHIRPGQPSRALLVSIPQGRVLSSTVNGKNIGLPSGERWGLYCVGIPEDGIDLELEMTRDQPLQLQVVEQIDGFPKETANLPPCPSDLMPSPQLPFGFSTLVSKTYSEPSKIQQ